MRGRLHKASGRVQAKQYLLQAEHAGVLWQRLVRIGARTCGTIGCRRVLSGRTSDQTYDSNKLQSVKQCPAQWWRAQPPREGVSHGMWDGLGANKKQNVYRFPDLDCVLDLSPHKA